MGGGGDYSYQAESIFPKARGKKRTPERGLIKCYSTDVLQISDMSHVLLHDVNLPYTWINLSCVLVSNRTKEITAHTAKFLISIISKNDFNSQHSLSLTTAKTRENTLMQMSINKLFLV